MKKALAINLTDNNIDETIKNLRSSGYNCDGFGKNTLALLGDCNASYRDTYCGTVFITDGSAADEDIIKSFEKFIPVLRTNVNTDVRSINEFLDKTECGKYDLAAVFNNRPELLKSRLADKDPVCCISGSDCGLAVGAVMRLACTEKAPRFVYFDNGKNSKSNIIEFVRGFEKFADTKVDIIHMDTSGISDPAHLEKAQADALYKLHPDFRGYARSPRSAFDGIGKSVIYIPYSGLWHPKGFLPLILPCEGLFEDEIRETEKILRLPPPLIAAHTALIQESMC